MIHRTLGGHGREVSVIGYGSWEAGGDQWGRPIPDDQVIAAMHVAFQEGINWVDTAEIYGAGRSEELVGRAIGDRDAMVFTKVAPAPRGSGFEPPDLRRAIQASLGRLRRDVIDVYQLHWPDPEIPVEGTWEGMARLVDDGLARMIGVSNFTENLIERCERIRHVDSLQPQLSMLWQERRPLLPFCACNGTGVIAYGPLAYGLLTGAITAETTFSDDDWRSGKRGLRAYEQRRFKRANDFVKTSRTVGKMSLMDSPLTCAVRNHVVVIGFGQVGMAVTRHLVSLGIPVLALDYDPKRVREVLGPRAQITHRPVLDLAGQAPVDAWEIPDRHRQAVRLMTPADTFPFATASVNQTDGWPGMQIDHTIPYPDGPSAIGNYGPLTTQHHNLKTHGDWDIAQPFPGIYLWRDPHGAMYLVDHTGTRRLRDSEAA
jgi:aryl-alcohol dehydrogenase-like predicted oxidoreductase